MWKVEETAKDNVHVAVSFKIKKASELAVAHGMPNIGWNMNSSCAGQTQDTELDFETNMPGQAGYQCEPVCSR